MSGHSKWATIHRKKGLIDAQRGKIFQKLAKEIYVAARGTDGKIENNPSLRLVIEKAKSQNMPKDNIQKAIEKAVGSSNNDTFDNLRYEGYGPNGVAIIIDCLTDNKNRTASLVRSTLSKKGGNLGTDGSVSYMFVRKGILVFESEIDEDTLMMTALDNGAIDFEKNGNTYEVQTLPEDLLNLKDILEGVGVQEFLVSEVTLVPNQKIECDDENYDKVQSLIDSLEEIEDVQEVYHNMM